MTLPPIGSSALFSRLLSIFHTTVPLLDPVIAQSILLCLISGNNHLILRSSEQDLALVVKFATLALSSIFNYQTHRIKIRPSSDASNDPTNDFLRSLFLTKLRDTRPRSGKYHRHVTRSYSYPSELSGEEGSVDPIKSFRLKSPPHSDPTPVDHADAFQQTLEVPRAVVVSGLEHVGAPAQRALVDVLRENRVILEGGVADGVWNLPDGFIMVYVCPWDPREHPAIHKSLLDRFAMSATVTLHPSARHAFPSMSLSNSSGTNLRPPTSPSSLNSSGTLPVSIPALLHTFRAYHKHVFRAPTLSLYTSDLFSAARNHPQLDGTLLGSRARTDADTLIAAARVLGIGREITVPLLDDMTESGTNEAEEGRLGIGLDESEVRVLNVSDADVARIVPRVISHRVRVRDGPEDEVLESALFGAVGRRGSEDKKRVWERSTVKDILVQILADV